MVAVAAVGRCVCSSACSTRERGANGTRAWGDPRWAVATANDIALPPGLDCDERVRAVFDARGDHLVRIAARVEAC